MRVAVAGCGCVARIDRSTAEGLDLRKSEQQSGGCDSFGSLHGEKNTRSQRMLLREIVACLRKTKPTVDGAFGGDGKPCIMWCPKSKRSIGVTSWVTRAHWFVFLRARNFVIAQSKSKTR